jgi:branched-chain amino acid transport system ATP-binding protein
MMTICGNPRAREGRIVRRRDITRMPTHEIMRLRHRAVAGGPAHLPAHDRAGEPADGRVVGPTRRISTRISSASSTLFPILKERAPARRHAVGRRAADAGHRRALMSRPRLLLLDEPSLGLAPLIVKQIFDVIRELNARDG